MKSPVAFLSSFYQEVAFGEDRHHSPLWQLRQKLWTECFDCSYEGRSAIWVAEKSAPGLAEEKDKLEVVDRVVGVLLRSEIYCCILADKRPTLSDHGSLIKVADREPATSYFEIELYAAAMYGKRINLYVLEGFEAGPRLQTLLNILSWAVPDWGNFEPASADEIFIQIRKILEQHEQDHRKGQPTRQRLVSGLYEERGRRAPPGYERNGVLFLDGIFEQRLGLPQKDLVEDLFTKCEQVPTMERKLNRLWLAVRELMGASYFAKDVQSDGRLHDFLPLWNRTLSLWS